jgi:hypothetical protein
VVEGEVKEADDRPLTAAAAAAADAAADDDDNGECTTAGRTVALEGVRMAAMAE